MVQASASARDQIRDELCVFAQQHIDSWDSYADKEFRSSEFGFDFVSRQTEHEGNTLTVSKASVPGLTVEMHANFRENLVTMLPKLDERVSIVDCPPFEGLRCLVQ